jgi:hypothetical protein
LGLLGVPLDDGDDEDPPAGADDEEPPGEDDPEPLAAW